MKNFVEHASSLISVYKDKLVAYVDGAESWLPKHILL